MSRSCGTFLAWTVIILFLTFVAAVRCGDGGGERSAVYTGDVGYVDIESGSLITVGPTKELTKRARQLQIARDNLGFQQLVDSGLVFRLKRGDRVRVINAGFLYSEIRVESGRNVGLSGFLEPEMISRDYRR